MLCYVNDVARGGAPRRSAGRQTETRRTSMPRLILAPEQVDDWPTVRERAIVRTGTTQGYTRVAERRTWHPYAGLYGIGYGAR